MSGRGARSRRLLPGRVDGNDQNWKQLMRDLDAPVARGIKGEDWAGCLSQQLRVLERRLGVLQDDSFEVWNIPVQTAKIEEKSLHISATQNYFHLQRRPEIVGSEQSVHHQLLIDGELRRSCKLQARRRRPTRTKGPGYGDR